MSGSDKLISSLVTAMGTSHLIKSLDFKGHELYCCFLLLWERLSNSTELLLIKTERNKLASIY